MLFSRLFKKRRLIKRLWRFRQSNFPHHPISGSSAADFYDEKIHEKSIKDIVGVAERVEDKFLSNNDISNVFDKPSYSKKDEILDRPITDDELKRVFFRILERLTVKQLKLLLHTLEESAEDSAEFGDCVIFHNNSSSEKSTSNIGQSFAFGASQSSTSCIAQSSAPVVSQPSSSDDNRKTAADIYTTIMCCCANSPENLHKLVVKLFICDLRTLKSLTTSSNDISSLLVSPLCLTNSGRNSRISNVNSPNSAFICLNPYHYSISHEFNDYYFTSSVDVQSTSPTISDISTRMMNDLASEDRNRLFHGSPKRPRFYAACWENDVRVGDLIEVDETVFLFYASTSSSSPTNEKRKQRKRNNDILVVDPYLTNDISNNNKMAYKSYDMRLLVRHKRPADVIRVRQKIGHGFYLYSTASSSTASGDQHHRRSGPDDLIGRKTDDNDDVTPSSSSSTNEIDCVWLHNRGPLTLFVQSTYLRDEAYVEHPIRLMTGYSLLVHKCKRNRPVGNDNIASYYADDTGYHDNSGFSASNYKQRTSAGGTGTSIAADSSVFISFSKCWGENYKRTLITCCPCWVQLIFPVR